MNAASPGSARHVRAAIKRFPAVLESRYLRIFNARIVRRSARGGLYAARRWRRKRRAITLLEIFSYLGAIVLSVVVVWSLVVMIIGPGILTRLNDRCGKYSAACGAEVGFLIPILTVALASATFLFFRLRRVTSPVVKKAKNNPQRMVETATPDIDEVVGRNELCRVIMEDIHHPDTRRPHLLVGGVGTGKTAVLVQLTKLFAQHHAVPVPIRLREAEDQLNFRKMAHARFLAMAESSMLSTDDAEKVWRQLSKDDKIVVIADGLDEALTGESVRQDRDNTIRLAIHRARELGMPLIITSRPHDPLRGADATIMELEPLSEEAALSFITKDGDGGDPRWLDWIVETAGLTELPLYLKLTRQLWQRGQLDYLSPEWSAEKMDMRSMDRSRLRFHLLDKWMRSLYDGHLATAPLDEDERKAAVKWLSALACIGLKEDSIDVKIDGYYKAVEPESADANPEPKYAHIDQEIRNSIDLGTKVRNLDIRLAVTWAAQLQLVEAHADGLRFRHSIMQAYLGSSFMRTALEDSAFRRDVKTSLRKPGRELLMALVLYSRSQDAVVTPPLPPEAAATTSPPAAMARQGAAGSQLGAPAGPRPSRRGSTSNGQTPAGPADPEGDPPPLDEPELRSDVGSIRDVLRYSAYNASDSVKKLDLYAATLEIDSFLEQSHHRDIAVRLAHCWNDIQGVDQRTLDEAKRGLVCRFGDAARTISDHPSHGKSDFYPAYRQLLEIGGQEPSYPVRLAIAQEIGAGGDDAFQVLHKPFGDPAVSLWAKTAWPDTLPNANMEHRTLHGRTLCAWLTPLLVGSARDFRPEARQELERWLNCVGDERSGAAAGLDLSLEVALAQGFKYAANRRRHHPHALSDTRFYLAEQAMEMLGQARFWFSQLTLIHALCLWEMPDAGVPLDSRAAYHPNGSGPAKGQGRRPGGDPEAIVGRWLEVAKNKDHPYVSEAGKLAVQALKTGHPERFLWIDESGVVSTVGSRAAPGKSYRKHHLWIPPSSGWATLDPRARQLVGDVLILLNLAERGQGPGEIEQRLRRANRSDLPPCISQDRDSLDARATAGGVSSAPGTNCTDGCLFRLCPYPPRGVQPYRSELGEAFCRGQQALLGQGLTAPWQGNGRADLKRFWEQMADRARGATEYDLD
ncbi:MAG TPA: ATP-binding protein [Streptosporangiaceae bacterium]